MDPFCGFSLETRNRWNFHRTRFPDGIHHSFSDFSGSASDSGFTIVPFPDVSNVQRPNRIIFFSRSFTFFIMWEFELIPVYLLLSIWGGKKRLYSATKFLLYTAGGSVFLLMGVLGMGFYGSNEATLHFETSANQSYPVAVEILFYCGFLITYAVKSPIIPLTYMVTRYPWGGTLQYVYASSRNLIKNGSVWIGSDQYGIYTPGSFYIFPLVDDTRYSSNNLCSFNISWPTQFKKENSLFFCISYGFYNSRNWFYNRYRTK